MSSGKYRLVTRSDFDGLVCAAILKELNMIDEIKFVHPKDMQDGVIEITNRDITTSQPPCSCEGVHLAFDHFAAKPIPRRQKRKSRHRQARALGGTRGL